MMSSNDIASRFGSDRVLYHTDRVWDWLNKRVMYPVSMELDLTLNCNDACTHCSYKFARQACNMPLNNIISILREANELGIHGLTLTGGGEPLLHPEINKVMDEICTLNLRAGIFTNASSIKTYEFANHIVTTFDWVRVSLNCYSIDKFYAMRGRDDFEKRIESLKLLVRARNSLLSVNKCRLGVNYLTSSYNSTDILLATREIKKIGFDYIRFRPMTNYEDDYQRISPKMYEQTNAYQEVVQAHKEFNDDEFQVHYSPFQYGIVNDGTILFYSSFHIAWFVISIGPSITDHKGKPTLYLDCSNKYLPEWTIGTFSTLRSILDSERRRQFIQHANSSMICVKTDRLSRVSHYLDILKQKFSTGELSREELEAKRSFEVWSPWNL